MIDAWLLLLALAQSPPAGMLGRGVPVPVPALGTRPTVRTYHPVPIAKLATTRHTHVCVTGLVVYVRRQRDGDVHVTLAEGSAKAVLEIIPLIPLPVPKKGTRIEACGIARRDGFHRWGEVHPLEFWKVRS